MAFVEAELGLGALSNITALTTVKRPRVDGHLVSNSEQSESNIDLVEIDRSLAGSQRAAYYMKTVDTGLASNSPENLPISNFEPSATKWTNEKDIFGITDAHSSTAVGPAFDGIFGMFGGDGQSETS